MKRALAELAQLALLFVFFAGVSLLGVVVFVLLGAGVPS